MSEPLVEDDLLDDLMSIVHHTDDGAGEQSHQSNNNSNAERESPSGNEVAGVRGRAGSELDEDELDEEDDDDEENSIDELLEKPIDILDDKKDDQVNFYTYDKIQIKSKCRFNFGNQLFKHVHLIFSSYSLSRRLKNQTNFLFSKKDIYWRGCQDTILPEGWVQVTHACGMPLYLNRATRVCTLARPYYIGGETSARKHDIPVSAIPCMAYQRRKEIIEKQMREHQEAKKCPFGGGGSKTTGAGGPNQTSGGSQKTTPTNSNNKRVTVSITTNEEKARENMIPAAQVHDYCRRLFEFDVIKVRKFKTWHDRKKFIRKGKQRRAFPENSKLLKIQTKNQKGINKELNINMTNKTPLSILYEYSNQVFKANPRFVSFD